ncbi:RecX family transcriptional regulator [Novosphingobium sp. G106]|uniref:regulatory protein RecX n=1 Tax=Novosphingobium sp. G106 TaxID=2849500 RepID=UPI001C2DD283|nr:RecX family transcriptional regulator [Novosphingobium sp. G106]MBV1688689.1 RecX family transcriptional regulator [Novosphingobium sp. G106]
MIRQSPGTTPEQSGKRRAKRPLKPLDSARLDELALAYVARFATSRAKLESYLVRKLRERGWADEGEPAVAALAARFVAAGYVDDAAFARAKSGSLLRRGYGQRRIGEALGAAGIGEDIRAEVRAGEGARRQAALVMARKRRLGPFGPAPADRAAREKQIAAMLRAGHGLDSARELVNAASVEAAEDWAAQASDDD